ncbi:MAG: DUF2800 domain-containing protein [Akkermansia sp.]|nr:DUF2800 domain-containing protein [Akkermansia sp.]
MGAKTIDHSTRAHALLSASSAHRWLKCSPSAVAAELYPRQDTVFTREGTQAHEAAEIVAKARLAGREVSQIKAQPWPKGTTEEMVVNAFGYADYIQEHITGEDALVLLESRVDFSPWVPDGFGTCDCIIIQSDTLTVIDYKYGEGVPVSAVDNPQMKLYALGALNDYGFAYDVEKIETHIYQPRINNISVEKLTLTDLMDWGEKIKPIAAKAAKGEGEYTPGEHCKFCPHTGQCRRLADVCLTYVKHRGVKIGVPVLAPFEVAEALEMEPLITLWLKRVKEQAMTSMLNGEQVPGWKVVEGKLGNRKWVDDVQAFNALMNAGYSVEAVTETKLLSPAMMDKAIGKKTVAELLTDHITREPGKPTLARESDTRPEYNRDEDIRKALEAE